MTTSEERQQVLRMIADGKITPEEGSRLLAALSGGKPPALAESAVPGEQSDNTPRTEQAAPQQQAYTPEQEVVPHPPPIEEQMPDTRHWWQVPFWIGAALLVAGAFTLAGGLSGSAICLALLCGLPMLLIGILAVIVAWFARNGPWVHIRVKNDRPGEHNVNISVPLDLGVVAVRLALDGPVVRVLGLEAQDVAGPDRDDGLRCLHVELAIIAARAHRRVHNLSACEASVSVRGIRVFQALRNVRRAIADPLRVAATRPTGGTDHSFDD